MYLPSYEEAKIICENYDNFQFYETIYYIDDYKISTFNYRLVKYNDFANPKDTSLEAFELRGLTFVFNKDNTLFKRFLLLKKYFNLNQVETTLYDNVKNLKIKDVYDKVDGSVINFIKLPNGKILTKSKMCVDNIQALEAHKIYESNKDINDMVNWSLDRDIMPIMEYVSPTNRVVLKYIKSDLILLKFRCLKTGNFLDFDIYPNIDKINTAKKEEFDNIDDIIKLVDDTINKEGWVVNFENNFMIKIKTKSYVDLHHTITESIYREDFLITKILDEEIDDVISIIPKDEIEILNLIDKITIIVYNYVKETMKICEIKTNEFYDKYNGSKKDFSINYGTKDKYYSYVMKHITGFDLLDIIKTDLKKYIYRLEQAREFIKNETF